MSENPLWEEALMEQEQEQLDRKRGREDYLRRMLALARDEGPAPWHELVDRAMDYSASAWPRVQREEFDALLVNDELKRLWEKFGEQLPWKDAK